MTFVRSLVKNGKAYYYLIESKREKFSNQPKQKSLYLGRYHKAYSAIKSMKISSQLQEKFLTQLKTKENKLNSSFCVLSNKNYNCIVIDPPWFYQLRKDDKTHRNRIPYPPMKIEEILALPIPDLCDKQGTVLWLWFTNNHMIEAADCIRHWGFELKTILTWEKISKAGTTRIGTGHWLRNCTEHCILATKGSVASFSHSKKLTNEPTILKAPRREHSRKPEEFYTLVEHLCEGTKLEMFAREQRKGWDAWGNEVDKFNN